MDNMTFLNQYSNKSGSIATENALILKDEQDRSKEILLMEQNVIYSRDELSELGIIHQAMDETKVANAFRNLRTSLLKQMDRSNSTILISALSEQGGASFTSTNLAAAFAFDQKKTALLIDCNFKKSSLAKNLGVDVEHGLRDYITEQVDSIASIVYQTVVPRLRLVPCGYEDDDCGEFFTGRKMRAFMEEVTARYPDRVIILNAPPILDSADTQILAELCEHIVFVLPYGNVSPDIVNKAVKSIDSSKIAGFVINN